jgi:hypothetical protein
MCRLFADDHVAQHTWDQMFGKCNVLMRRLAAKNRLAGMVELGVRMFVTQRLWIPPSEVGRVPGSY